MKKIFFTFYICFIFVAPVNAADDSLLLIKQQLDRINRDITDLQKEIFVKNPNQVTFDNSNQVNESEKTSEVSVFDMRLRDIENELKTINLAYEDISFEIEELKTSLEELTLKINNSLITKNNENAQEIEEGSELAQDINIIGLEANDEINNDEINVEEENTLGKLKISSEDLSKASIESKNEELLNDNSNLSPEEKYQIAFDFMRSQKFDLAMSELKKFIKDFPSHALTGSAHYWLGEMSLLRKEYREAALVFAEGYQKYPESLKAPESLYKLGESLIRIDKLVEACDTLDQFVLKYPNHKLIEKTKIKINDLKCN